jgi:hypothetical protein
MQYAEIGNGGRYKTTQNNLKETEDGKKKVITIKSKAYDKREIVNILFV